MSLNFSLKNPKLILLILFLFGLSYIIPLTGIVLFILFFPIVIKWETSYFEKLFISFLSFISINTSLYTIFTLVKIQLPIKIIGILYLSLLLIIIRGIVLKPIKIKRMVLPRATVAYPVVLFIVTFCALMYPILVADNTKNLSSLSQKTLSLLMSGEDNASHFAIFNYGYSRGELAYGKNDSQTGLIESLVNYPQGTQFTPAILLKSTSTIYTTNMNSHLIVYYYVFMAIYMSLLSYIVTLLIFKISEKIYSSSSHYASILTMLSLTPFMLGGLNLMLFSRGFHSQILAYVFMLSILYTLIERHKISNTSLIFILTLLVCGLAVTWWLLLPLAVVVVGVSLLKNKGEYTNTIRMKNVLICLFLLLINTIPIVLNLIYGQSAGGINQPGGVDKFHVSSYILIFVISYSYIFIKKSKQIELIPYKLFLIGATFFSILIAIYQIITSGKLEYYFYKYSYIFISLALVISGIFLIQFFSHIIQSLEPKKRILFFSYFLICLVCVILLVNPVYPRVFYNDWFNNPVNKFELSHVLTNSDRSKSDVQIYAGGCNAGTSYLLNRWSGAFMLSENSWKYKININTLEANNVELVKIINKIDSSKRSFIHIRNGCEDSRINRDSININLN